MPAMRELDYAALRRQARWRWAGLLLLFVSLYGAAQFLNLNLSPILTRAGWDSALGILSGLLKPDFSPDFLRRIFSLTLESLCIGLVGGALALLLGAGMALCIIRVPDLVEPPQFAPLWRRLGFAMLRQVLRILLAGLRAVPEIVWAYVFVRLFGLGVLPAVLAIGLTVGASIAKLFAELAEAVDARPLQTMRAAGAGRSALLLFGVLPQVARQWLAYALFRLECNIRSGAILGVVGAGGLGSEIVLALRYFQYDKLATALLAVLCLTLMLEFCSARLRRLSPRTVLMALTASALTALYFLDAPWRDLLQPAGMSLLSFDAPLQLDTLRHATRLVLDTLVMAWCATWLAAGGALLLAPLAARQLRPAGYLPDAVRPPGWRSWLDQTGQIICRSLTQVVRALPELCLALVFVVWVGAGPLAGILAIALHNLGVLGRLYADVLEEAAPAPVAALQSMGLGRLGCFMFGVWPQVRARLAAFTLYRFEVNVRVTAMMGFVGAGGIGDALHTAISLFHMQDLSALLLTMALLVALVDALGDRVRSALLRTDQLSTAQTPDAAQVATRLQAQT
ncbi:ABC transporter permease subunit [Massilia sp. W12]|uniref:PhnE/PtxC family ABC transporter permease n=1 Tax=Massilia sp. W12 TaxID=3126507 RepID=UPI0030D23D42